MCPFEISNTLTTSSTVAGLKSFDGFEGRLRQASDVASRPHRLSRDRAGFDVYLEPKDLDEKLADLDFLGLSRSRCGTHRPHPFQASSGSMLASPMVTL